MHHSIPGKNPGRQRLIRTKRQGVGGFIEAMLAIVIVTSGMMLLSLAFSLMELDDTSSSAEEGCQQLMEEVLKDAGQGTRSLLIDRSQLDDVNLSRPEKVRGYSVFLIEIMEDDIINLSTGGEGYYAGGERYQIKQPISISFSSRDVRAAVLVVWVW